MRQLEEAYNNCGFRTLIHTSTGVDSVAGTSKVSPVWFLKHDLCTTTFKVVVGKYAGEDMALDSFIEADTQGRDTSGQKSEDIKVIRFPFYMPSDSLKIYVKDSRLHQQSSWDKENS